MRARRVQSHSDRRDKLAVESGLGQGARRPRGQEHTLRNRVNNADIKLRERTYSGADANFLVRWYRAY
jgi:hypothetical protein